KLTLGVGYGVRDAATFLIEADFFGDGSSCVAVADGGRVSLMRPSGGRMRVVSSFEVSQAAVALSVGDLNGDGRPDLAGVDGLMGDVSVAYNIGSGRFVVEGGFGVGSLSCESGYGELGCVVSAVMGCI